MSYRWSFGGNRLQIKAETHLLTDVLNALKMVQAIGAGPFGALASLQAKQDLLSTLLADEQTRLLVWLFPLDYHSKHHFASGLHHGPNDVSFCLSVRLWTLLIPIDHISRHGETCLARESSPCSASHTTILILEACARCSLAAVELSRQSDGQSACIGVAARRCAT